MHDTQFNYINNILGYFIRNCLMPFSKNMVRHEFTKHAIWLKQPEQVNNWENLPKLNLKNTVSNNRPIAD